MNVPLVCTILYIGCVMLLAILGYIDDPNETVQYGIVEYTSPRLIIAPNGTSVFIVGTVGANAHQNFTNVVINVAGIGEQGQIVADKNVELHNLTAESTVDYNVSVENTSTIVAGEIRVLNTTIAS